MVSDNRRQKRLGNYGRSDRWRRVDSLDGHTAAGGGGEMKIELPFEIGDRVWVPHRFNTLTFHPQEFTVESVGGYIGLSGEL